MTVACEYLKVPRSLTKNQVVWKTGKGYVIIHPVLILVALWECSWFYSVQKQIFFCNWINAKCKNAEDKKGPIGQYDFLPWLSFCCIPIISISEPKWINSTNSSIFMELDLGLCPFCRYFQMIAQFLEDLVVCNYTELRMRSINSQDI